MNVARFRQRFSNRRPQQHPPHPHAPRLPKKKPIPTGGDPIATKRTVRSLPSKPPDAKDWTTIAWPTNIQSKTPDGKFGPAKQIHGWGDCWFIAPLAAVANDEEGRQILAESIKPVNGGYEVTFKGAPQQPISISKDELQQFLAAHDGDADTRMMELAADKFFKKRGNFKSSYIAGLIKYGLEQDKAEQCFESYCSTNEIQDPMTYNPMRDGMLQTYAFFMFTGMIPDFIALNRNNSIQRIDVIRFLNKYVTNDRNGSSVVIAASENPLGDSRFGGDLVILWDVIRTDITSNGIVNPKQRAFLNALEKWLKTSNPYDLRSLRGSARNLKLAHIDPLQFVNMLVKDRSHMQPQHITLLRSAVQEVLSGGPGYIGFSGDHAGTLEGINPAANTFTYSEPNYPTVVHTGELSHLIQQILSGNVDLTALELTLHRHNRKLFDHTDNQRARQLKQLHHQVVGDGKIDHAESSLLANLIQMDDRAFWHVYDSDNNGVIEGGELKAVQLRVDRWVEHFKLGQSKK
jgi:hypothetical protein